MNHQAGVSSTWHPMPHDHSNVSQGGAVPILSISGHLKALHDALAINADQVDGVDLPGLIAAILTDHNKALHDALAINADQVDGEEAVNIVTNARVKAHFPDTIANILSNHSKAVHDALKVEGGYLGASTNLTIAGGRITVTKNYHKILGQGGVADNLVTINGGFDGMLLILKGNAGHNILVKDGDGNIELYAGADFGLNGSESKLALIYDDEINKWVAFGKSHG